MVLTSTLLHTMKRQTYIIVAVVLCVWLCFVGVGLALVGRTRSPSLVQHPPTRTAAGNRALTSAARSTFEAMLTRRNHSVLADSVVGRSTGGRKKLLSYQQSPDVATSGATSHRRVNFGLRTVGMAIADVRQQGRI